MRLTPKLWPTFEDLSTGVRLFVNTTRLLRAPVDLERSYTIVRERLEQRTANFLRLTRDAVCAVPGSPFHQLLALAGCDHGDLERLVQQDGLEGTLYELYRRGVYLTVDESKGRRPVVRGSASFTIDPRQLRNPSLAPDLVGQTSGSRGARAPVPMEIQSIRENIVVEVEGGGGADRVHAQWSAPGTGALRWPLKCAARGDQPARWFSPIDPVAAGLHPRYVWSARVVRWAGRLAGQDIPAMEYVPFADPLPIVRWMAALQQTGQKVTLDTTVTGAVRICQAACEAQVRLGGVHFTVSGEPMTTARMAAIHRAGAVATTQYAATEPGAIGRGCLAALEPDEVHFFQDRLGMIQPGEHGTPDLPPQALLMTSLLPSTKLILINVSTGDQAEMTNRACGCPLERLGWTTHLHTIRSFEKLTAGGMTFFDADVIRVLEDLLPSQFGGGPTDYQLVDEETDNGSPGVSLLVHPRLGPIDSEQVRQTFLGAIGGGSGVERIMEQVWHDAGLPIMRREIPLTTPGGKLQHVHRATH